MATMTQVQRTQVSAQVSQELVQTMLSASFGCISYLRGIFPDDSFLEERFNASRTRQSKQSDANSDTGQRLMRLRRDATPEAAALLDYLEKGVFDALNKRYLMSVILTISLDEAEFCNVHEAYTFQIIYSSDKFPSLLVKDMTRNKSTSAMPLDSAKRSMQQLFRQLITMTQSLSPLPEDVDKILAIRLFYNDTAPDDYQPTGFRDASVNESARFVTKFDNDRPHDQEIGSLNTGYHACTLRISTISDIEEHDSSRGPEALRFWDAEHHAKQSFLAQHPGNVSIKSQYQALEPFDNTQLSNPEVRPHAEPGIVPDSQDLDCAATQLITAEGNDSSFVDPDSRLDNCSLTSQFDRLATGCGRITRAATSKMDRVTDSVAHLDIGHADHGTSGQTQAVEVPMTDYSPTNEKAAKSNAEASNEKLLQSQDVVSCECGDSSDDGVMVQCESCEGWTHLPCYGYMDASLEEGYVHHCYTCRTRKPEDLEGFRSLAIMRRALHGLWLDGYNYVTTKEFGKSIGVEDLRTASGILQRLVNEGWLANHRKRSASYTKAIGRGNKKASPGYEVVRSAANGRRLRIEYFDPQKGLDKVMGKSEHPSSRARVAAAGGALPVRDTVPANSGCSLLQSQTIPVPQNDPGFVDRNSSSVARPSDNTNAATIQLSTSTTSKDRKRPRNSISNLTSAIQDSADSQVLATVNDTTDDELNEDLGQAIPAKVMSAVCQPSRRASRAKKRPRVSIVEKAVIACAY